LPDDFGQLAPNLRFLNLNFNSLEDLRPLLNIKRLEELLLAGNRLKRLRTNVAVLAKLKTLSKLDLRDNPVTMRFYAPTVETRIVSVNDASHDGDDSDRFVLPPGSPEADTQHLARLDEETKLRRRVHEMMIGSNCKNLRELDGLSFDEERVGKRDAIWQRLLDLNIIKKTEPKDDAREENPRIGWKAKSQA
jgi:Leucine-rich repeat (LRR) protein